MNELGVLALVLAIAACGGCKPAASPALPKSRSQLPGLAEEAQPKLATVKLYLGPEQMSAELAATAKQVETGMMWRTNMAENESMLFDLKRPGPASFWMPNCPLPLSVAYINPEGYIEEIHNLEPFNTNGVHSDSQNVLFALETNQGWFQRHNIKPGILLKTELGTLKETFAQKR